MTAAKKLSHIINQALMFGTVDVRRRPIFSKDDVTVIGEEHQVTITVTETNEFFKANEKMLRETGYPIQVVNYEPNNACAMAVAKELAETYCSGQIITLASGGLPPKTPKIATATDDGERQDALSRIAGQIVSTACRCASLIHGHEPTCPLSKKE